MAIFPIKITQLISNSQISNINEFQLFSYSSTILCRNIEYTEILLQNENL